MRSRLYIAPCKADGRMPDGTPEHITRASAAEAEFWTLYERDPDGLSQALSDHATRTEALIAAVDEAQRRFPLPPL